MPGGDTGGVAVTRWVRAPISRRRRTGDGFRAFFGTRHRTERVQFPTGATGTTLSGRLNGGDAVNYVLGARDGQFLSVSLAPESSDTHFNVFVPGGGTLFKSSAAERRGTGTAVSCI